MQFSQLASAVRTGILGLSALGAIVLFAGCGGGSSTVSIPRPLVLAPACSNPSPLTGSYDPQVPQYVVVLTPGEISAVLARNLEARHGFTLKYVYPGSSVFAAELSPKALASLRCDPLVVSIAYDIAPFPR
ncbi:MAG: hypothetical protein V4671_06115 [Armatimonadota bacterium]